MEQEVDLERMKRLLDSFNEDERKKEKIRYNYAKSLCTQGETGININYESICMMLNNHGTIAGRSNKLKHEHMFDDIVAHLTPEALQSAKGCIIIYFINPNDDGVLKLTDGFEQFSKLLPENIELDLATGTSTSIDIGKVEYRFILVGCKQSEQKNNEFFLDNKLLSVDSQFVTIKNSDDIQSSEEFLEIEEIKAITYHKSIDPNDLLDVTILLSSHKYKLTIKDTKANIEQFNRFCEFIKKQKRFIKLGSNKG